MNTSFLLVSLLLCFVIDATCCILKGDGEATNSVLDDTHTCTFLFNDFGVDLGENY